jgi:hypothetical protein
MPPDRMLTRTAASHAIALRARNGLSPGNLPIGRAGITRPDIVGNMAALWWEPDSRVRKLRAAGTARGSRG